MNDTVQKLIGMIDEHARNASEATRLDYETGHLKSTVKRAFDDVQTSRQALQDELVKLFTPLTEEQIAYIAINQQRPEPWSEYPLFLTGPGVGYKKFRSAGENGWVTLEDLVLFTRFAEAAHGITGESK